MMFTSQFSLDSSSPSKWEHFLFWGFFSYFGFKALYFALRIREKVFPDEASWFGICEVFSRSILAPVDSPESYPLGLITHKPNLYFFLMGKVLTLNFSLAMDLIFLRLINVGLGVLTIYFSWRLVRLLSSSLPVRLLFIVMLTNTTMYTFIFGAVNYDNLVNLFAVLSLYCLGLFFKGRRSHDILLFGIFLQAGMLTKNVFLPYAFALVLVLLFHERNNLVNLSWVNTFFSNRFTGKMVLLSVCLALFILNLNLYAGNKIKYGNLIPGMQKVLSVDNCLKNRLFARNYGADQFKRGKLTMVEAQRIALQIRDPGDRAFAWAMIEKAKKEKEEKKKVRMGRLQYSAEWCKYMLSRTYGVAAHLVMSKSKRELYPYYVVFGLGILLLLTKVRSWGSGIGYLSFVTCFYLIILMQVVNYNNYLGSGFVGLALTGRYIFPVLVPLYILIAYGLMEKMPRWWQWGVGLLVSGIFIYGEFPWFLQNVTPDWYFG